MNQETHELWLRAVRSYKSAAKLAEEDPDSAASRAYSAAFHAVSPLFALQDQACTKPRALKAAVYRDLVQVQTWSAAFRLKACKCTVV
jgi:uncharacterized protein (UPF0332 family)